MALELREVLHITKDHSFEVHTILLDSGEWENPSTEVIEQEQLLDWQEMQL